jgi:hypothetical protein
MKKVSFFKYALFFIASFALISLSSCSDDDDDVVPILVEDGFYIVGDVTPFSDLDFQGIMQPGKNEVGQEMRPGMYEKFITLRAGTAGFSIKQVAGQSVVEWGPDVIESVNLAGEREQPNITVQKGTLKQGGIFTVPSDGLYHIIVDTESSRFLIAPAGEWAYIGQATGWSDSPMTKGAFNMERLTWSVENLELRLGEFKLRYGGGWKIEISGDDVKVNSNLGGEIEGEMPNLTLTTIPGGSNYQITQEIEGIYTINLEWTIADGFKATMTKTDDVPDLGYPEELYMTGAATGGWSWDDGVYVPMTKISDGVFEATTEFIQDEAFRFFAQPDWGPLSKQDPIK